MRGQELPGCILSIVIPTAQWPMNGDISVPQNNMDKKIVIAKPLLWLSKISLKIAGLMASKHAAKKPLKNRQIKIVCRSFPVLTTIEKIEQPKPEIRRGRRRPSSSDVGAQRMGPNAKPRTKRDTLSSPTWERRGTGTRQSGPWGRR